MTTTAKFFTDNMGGTAANSYIGIVGEVFYDTAGVTPLRLSDGHTPGGIAFGITSINNTFNPDAKAAGGALTGAVSVGTYVKQGLVVHFEVYIDFTNCTDFQASSNTQYQFTLPFPIPAGRTVTVRGGTLHQNTGNTYYHISGIVDPNVTGNTSLMKLYYFGSTQDLPLRAAVPVGALSNTSTLDFSGSYITSSTVVS